ncbi:MAG: glutamine--tRNA ligase/YqeY domain fusion protein, partial [Acidobacteriota bacterium]
MSAIDDPKPDDASAVTETNDFIREKIRDDLAARRYDGVVTRFPPEPNGYPHIGHAKAICLNFGVAADFGGRCHLRFDDTNPETESPEYVEALQRDIRWLGFDWGEHLYFASDYFERMVELAEQLIRDGKAYVDSQSSEEIRANRGSISEAGTPSPFRDRSVEVNLDLLRRMRDGEFDDGAHVVRAKIDMSAANMLMRDPLLLRIRKAHHYRRGEGWCLYPMYDYAHCLEDAFENVTHSLCSLEFENNRELYDWVLDACGFEHPRPEQTEFARLNLGYTVMSKRKLLKLVQEGVVAGWDDPRMPTLSGLRRRGVPPEAIRDFCERVGVTRNYNIIDVALLEHATREALNFEAPRRMAVIEPLKVVVENWPEEQVDRLDADDWPRDVPKEGSRQVPFSRELWIDRDDFREDPPEGYFRLAPGREVRLRYAYLLTCRDVVRDADGAIVELRCTVDLDSRGGNAPDGRKVAGTIHWVAAAEAVESTFRVYDRLFSAERPGVGPDGEEVDVHEHLNPDSLIEHQGFVEPSLVTAEPGSRWQFERLGYFVADAEDSRPGKPVWNRTVTLRDTWAKVEQQGDTDAARRAAERAAARRAYKEEQRRQAEEAVDAALDPADQAIADRYVERGVG